jgi:N-acylglucosamine-6-phosphate 2-epimerase
MSILERLHAGLIVSCQASADSPLRDSGMMAAMARAALAGGAVGIRANGSEDIRAIRAAVHLPIIGIYKQNVPEYDIYITPTLEAAAEVVQAGTDILAVDATQRPHPGGLTAKEFIQACKGKFSLPLMADISTLEEALAAAEAGADLVATTLVGYTAYTRQRPLPDFELITQLVKHIAIPTIVEGHIRTPEDACRALELGAYAVVVGAAITQPDWITAKFVESLNTLSRNKDSGD